MKKKCLIGVICITPLALMIPLSVNATPTTIESCVSLLPAGHKLKLSINGNIDTNKKSEKFDGKFTLSDDTQKDNPELQKLITPFVECIKQILR